MTPTTTTAPFRSLPGSVIEDRLVFECPKCGDRFYEYPHLGRLIDIIQENDFPHPDRTVFRFIDGKWTWEVTDE
jgi:hypothetical protein